MDIQWTDKYRPFNINDIYMDEIIHKKMNTIIKNLESPNMILCGPPGTGKTITIMNIIKELLGKYIEEYVLNFDATDDRGIKNVQEKMTHFCKKKIEYNKDDIGKYANHKIVLLDEADGITNKSQKLICNLMENYDNNTRFIFTCNDSTKIIEGIQSRCIVIKYNKLSNKKIMNKLTKICELEKMTYEEDGLKTLIEISNGDIRASINNLQIIYINYNHVNIDHVYKIFDIPHPLVIEKLFLMCYRKKYEDAFKILHKLILNGYSNSDISLSMINALKNMKNNEIKEETKIKYITEVGRTALNISRGIDNNIQLSGCIAKLCKM